MAPKRSSSKGREKETTSKTPSLDDRWLTTKCTESDILSLVDECLLQPWSIVKWRYAFSLAGQEKVQAQEWQMSFTRTRRIPQDQAGFKELQPLESF
jgi:hypothetical protein